VILATEIVTTNAQDDPHKSKSKRVVRNEV